MAAIVAIGWLAWTQADRAALGALEARGAAALELQAEALEGWLARFAALPSLYARDGEVVATLAEFDESGELTAAREERMNRRLEVWNALSGASDTYLLNTEGVAIATSNWLKEYSFLGQNYSFRPYFTQALNGRVGRFFALGTQSKKRGYYFSYPALRGDRVIGVLVVKVAVEAIETELGRGEGETFVSDQSGVVILAARQDWRFATLGPVAARDLAEIRRNRQFDGTELKPMRPDGRTALSGGLGRFVTVADATGGAAQEMLHLSRPIPLDGWSAHLLLPVASARAGARVDAALAAVLTLAGALILFIAAQRRRRYLERLREREIAGRRLELAVEARTEALRLSNENLAREVEERRVAEARLRETQRELVQAAKLAALGQMAASLSHEYNQPLAAIRAYAENAAQFLGLKREEEAADNLRRISALTARMARLSKNLTSFARKPEDSVSPLSLTEVVDSATELLAARLERDQVALRVDIPHGLKVMAGETRLQQVLVNLIRNAADAACAGGATPRIEIGAAPRGEYVELTVSDNGLGVPASLREQIFDPFFTTKEAGAGLGLGLSISFNIVRDFGGWIRVEDAARDGDEVQIGERRGAVFRVALRAAGSASQAPAGAPLLGPHRAVQLEPGE